MTLLLAASLSERIAERVDRFSNWFAALIGPWVWEAGGSAWTFYGVAVFGAVAIYLMLPGVTRRHRRGELAWFLGAAALAGLIVWMVGLRWQRSFIPEYAGQKIQPPASVKLLLAFIPTEAEPFFYLFAAIALIAAVKSMTHARPIYSVLYFLLTVLAVGAVLLLLMAEFLAIALILIYAGAILVLYVFVIMLAQQEGEPARDNSLPPGGGLGRGVLADYDARTRSPVLALLLSFLLVCGLGTVIGNWTASFSPMLELAPREQPPPAGTAAGLGIELFRQHLLSLELAGVLLLMAVVAAVALVRRRVSAK